MYKICLNCKQQKDISLFFKNFRSKDGFQLKCKDCVINNTHPLLFDDNNVKITPIELNCCKCKIKKSVNLFYKSKQSRTGYKSGCKECQEQQRWETKRSKKTRRKFLIDLNGFVLCIKCKEYKNVEEFSPGCKKQGKFRKNTHSYCKKCEVKRKVNSHKRNNEWTPERFLNKCFNQAKNGALERQLSFNINKEYLLKLYYNQKGLCCLSKEKMTCITQRGFIPTNISIDRIDNSKGYEIENIQLVCTIVNFMKSSLTKEQLIFWCKSIIANTGQSF